MPLLDLIDADQLPVEYGGTCSCSGGCIPVHLNNEIYVSAGSSHEATVQVSSGSSLTWAFQSIAHDISFEVVHNSPTGERKVLSPKERCTTAASKTVKGNVTISDPGTVSVIFDNSYSYWTGKTIKYRLDVEHVH